jgi:hypothetical protein
MYWTKTLPRVTYNLSSSSAPPASPEDFGAKPEDLSAAELGPYGHPELIAALAERYAVPAESVVPVPGASMGVYLALVASLERGDTVLVEAPTYETLPRQIEYVGGRAEWFARQESRHWSPDLSAVEAGLRRGARAVLLNNLHNPSGLRLADEDLAELVELTDRYGATLIVDEVYLDYAYINLGGRPCTAATLGPHVVATSSLTKAFGLGGLRAGWLFAAPEIAERVRRAMDHTTVNNSSPSMNLAIRALANIERLEARTRRFYELGRPVIRDWLESRPDLSCAGNDGALFVFVNLGPELDAQRLVDLLADKYDTLVVPGRFFDSPHHIRMSFALEPARLREALDRLAAAIDEARKTGFTGESG